MTTRILLTAQDAALYVSQWRRVPCQAVTVRVWASRGLLTARGYRGRAALYDVAEVEAVATRHSSGRPVTKVSEPGSGG